MKKKILNVLLSVLLSVIFFVSSIPVKTYAEGTFNTINNFDVDTKEYNITYYPSDIFEVKYYGKVIGKVYVVSMVATSKTNPRKQVLLVKTEMRPEDTNILLEWYHGVCESMKITVYYDYGSDMEETQYAPATTNVSGNKSSSSSIQAGINQKNGFNINATIGCQYSLPYGGFKVTADSKSSGRFTTQRSIKYYYDRESWRWNPFIQSSAKREINKPLNGDLIQTFAFEYDYTGSGKRPVIYYNINAVFRVARNFSRTWYGDGSNILLGNYTVDQLIGLRGE